MRLVLFFTFFNGMKNMPWITRGRLLKIEAMSLQLSWATEDLLQQDTAPRHHDCQWLLKLSWTLLGGLVAVWCCHYFQTFCFLWMPEKKRAHTHIALNTKFAFLCSCIISHWIARVDYSYKFAVKDSSRTCELPVGQEVGSIYRHTALVLGTLG